LRGREHAENCRRNNFSRHYPCSCLEGVRFNAAVIALSTLLYLLNSLFGKVAISSGFLTSHFNDVLAPLVLLPIAALIARNDCRSFHFVQSPAGAIVLTAGAAFVWEVLTPLVLSRSTADWLDVGCYAFGGAMYLSIRWLAQYCRCTSLEWPEQAAKIGTFLPNLRRGSSSPASATIANIAGNQREA